MLFEMSNKLLYHILDVKGYFHQLRSKSKQPAAMEGGILRDNDFPLYDTMLFLGRRPKWGERRTTAI